MKEYYSGENLNYYDVEKYTISDVIDYGKKSNRPLAIKCYKHRVVFKYKNGDLVFPNVSQKDWEDCYCKCVKDIKKTSSLTFSEALRKLFLKTFSPVVYFRTPKKKISEKKEEELDNED
jgi:hypothetical protein